MAIDVVVGGQFGSEAKGRVTLERIQYHAYPSQPGQPGQHVASMRVAGPNAGHVVMDSEGRRFAMRALPVGFVEPDVQLMIAPGSEVDFDVLADEIALVESYGYAVRNRLYIHPQATWLMPEHIEQEKSSDLVQSTGSTAKGIGAARAARVWRKAEIVGGAGAERFSRLGHVVDFVPKLRQNLREGSVTLVVEGTQGYGLGLHAGHYPQCTSSDCRAIDFLAMAGVSPWDLPEGEDFEIHMVVRPYPIRVAGNSGELAGETSWDQLGLDAERTTVTNKVRRVGQFDPELVAQAIDANGPDRVRIHLSMADQIAPSLAGQSQFPPNFAGGPDYEALMAWISKVPHKNQIVSLGTGPASSIWIGGVV